MQAPANQVVLTNTKNKIELNALLTEGILDPGYFTEVTRAHNLAISGVHDVPVEITGGLMIGRHDKANSQTSGKTLAENRPSCPQRDVCREMRYGECSY